MVKKCKDPICPANRYPSASHSEPQNGRHRKKSKSKKTRNGSNGRKRAARLDSGVKICKNKKCQASTATMESSTSTSPSPKICVRSLASNKFSNWRRKKCQDKKTICHCDNNEKTTTNSSKNRDDRRKKKHKSRRENKQRNKLMSSLCICVRESDSES
ncbi:uncharacterized protein LOC143208946 [Lasioglossum baleicum]|uniref:uncharacterized protein LOC143208946 n=1 Tax=Lasioglossum baleicum TaxID=434251 RepID=UPI003FCD3606